MLSSKPMPNGVWVTPALAISAFDIKVGGVHLDRYPVKWRAVKAAKSYAEKAGLPYLGYKRKEKKK